ncbi:DUF4190 domain-containing protein [Mycolicibacterium neoaurum]|uniref:DUF4190 domain-containing protein n=1 Tax=Mycolicibacterium neoaurum TaxID=1795 RepID=UPI001BD10D18|nr:DUF4190 domain-containing protein [Mycolicibacterium neoaurum]QVI29705.1 DUF4190 domain-containing protein [Mycolicibacterium neoaurum]
MTNPGEDAAATPPTEPGAPTESTASPSGSGYEAPPIERSAGTTDYPDYTPPPAYGYNQPPPTAQPPGYPQQGYAPGYANPGYTTPDYSATGYPPPPPGYGAPQDLGAPYPSPTGFDTTASYPGPVPGSYPGPPPGFGPPPMPQAQFGGPPPYGGHGGYPAGYPAPYGAPVPQNSMAVASLVCSGLAVPLFFLCFIMGIPATIAGIVLGIVALNQIKKTGQRGKELAISGIVLGGLVLAAGIALGIFIGALASVSP